MIAIKAYLFRYKLQRYFLYGTCKKVDMYYMFIFVKSYGKIVGSGVKL